MKEIQRFIEKLFVIDSNTSSTLILTLLTFFLGYLISYVVYSINRILTRKSIREVTVITLKSLIKSFLKTENSIQSTILRLKSGKWNMEYSYFYQLNVMKEITFKEGFNAFFYGIENFFCSNKLKTKSFTLLWSIVITTEVYQNEIKTQLESYLQKFNVYDENRNKEIDLIRKYYERILQPLRNDPNNIEKRKKTYLVKLNKIILKFQEFNSAQIILPEIQFENLILPIRDLNEEFQDLSESVELGDLLIKYFDSYLNMIATKGAFEGQLEEFRLFFRGARRSLMKILDILA